MAFGKLDAFIKGSNYRETFLKDLVTAFAGITFVPRTVAYFAQPLQDPMCPLQSAREAV